MPASMRAVHQRIRTFWAGAACGIVLGSALRPQIEERLHSAPATFDLRGALKQRLVAGLHVIQQSFVAGLVANVEMVTDTEIQRHWRSVQQETRNSANKHEDDDPVAISARHRRGKEGCRE